MKVSHDKYTIIYFFALLLLFSLAAYNIFYNLGTFPIYSWDEARHGVSAYEMLKNHNFIVNTYRYKSDYWNLKPILSFWNIILGYKLAGFDALGLRIMSAVFAMLTIIFTSVFTYKKYGKLASLVAALVLSTCTQFLINHSSRTGDADSLFIFFFTVAILSLLLWNQKHTWLYISGLAFSLAFLTKSWHAGNIAVIIGLYLILTGKFKKLSFKNWLLLLMSMVLPIFIWAVFRYQYDGLNFFQKMITYDLLKRSTSPIERHYGGSLYYFSILHSFFAYWIDILLISFFFLFFNKDFSLKAFRSSMKKDSIIGITLWALVPLILFTIAKTKIRWYILPMYPALAIAIGILTSKVLLKRHWIIKGILLISIVAVSLFYESGISNYVSHPVPNLKQHLIESAANVKSTKGDTLFIYHLSCKAVWLQSDILTGELADDLHFNNGNFADFLKSNKALLLIPKNLYKEKIIKDHQLKIIADNTWGYLVKKAV